MKIGRVQELFEPSMNFLIYFYFLCGAFPFGQGFMERLYPATSHADRKNTPSGRANDSNTIFANSLRRVL
jgi:hypothetical protein